MRRQVSDAAVFIGSLLCPMLYILVAMIIYITFNGMASSSAYVEKRYYYILLYFLPLWPCATLILIIFRPRSEVSYLKWLQKICISWFFIEFYYNVVPTEGRAMDLNFVPVLLSASIGVLYFSFVAIAFFAWISVLRYSCRLSP